MADMRSFIVGVAILAGCAATAARADFIARNGMTAAGNPARAGYFEVFQRALAGPSDYWCAAGEYARYGVGEHNTTRVYVVRGPGPSQVRPGRTSVIYSFVKYDDIPDLSEADKGYSVSVARPGYNLSAAHGTAFCRDSVRRFRRFGFW